MLCCLIDATNISRLCTMLRHLIHSPTTTQKRYWTRSPTRRWSCANRSRCRSARPSRPSPGPSSRRPTGSGTRPTSSPRRPRSRSPNTSTADTRSGPTRRIRFRRPCRWRPTSSGPPSRDLRPLGRRREWVVLLGRRPMMATVVVAVPEEDHQPPPRLDPTPHQGSIGRAGCAGPGAPTPTRTRPWPTPSPRPI